MKQISFATLAETGKKRKTKRERFLDEMEQIVPWTRLIALIEPHYPKAGKGRRPRGLEMMLRIYFMQHGFNLSDPGMEDALYDVPCMRAFAKLDLFDESMPDETTILKFRRLLEQHQLTSAIMNTINEVLEGRGLLLMGGTMVDTTIIHAPPSTKNESQKRDPEMHQTKKGKDWFCGMKIHVGADVDSGLVHTVSVTPTNAPDVSQLPRLLREDDRAVFGDKGYVDNGIKRAARGAGVFWGVALRARAQYKLTGANKRFNRKMSSIRSRINRT